MALRASSSHLRFTDEIRSAVFCEERRCGWCHLLGWLFQNVKWFHLRWSCRVGWSCSQINTPYDAVLSNFSDCIGHGSMCVDVRSNVSPLILPISHSTLCWLLIPFLVHPSLVKWQPGWRITPLLWGSGKRAVALMANAVLWPTKRFSKHPELPFSIFILQGLTVWQHRTLWEHQLELYCTCFSLEGHGRFQYGIWIQGAGGQMPGRNRPWHQSSDAAPNAEVRWSTAILQKSSKCFATVVLFDLGFFHVPAHGFIATAQREPKIHKSAVDEVDMLLLTLEPSHLSQPTCFQAQLGYLAQALLHDLTLHKSAWSSKLPGADSDHERPEPSIPIPDLEHWLNKQNASNASNASNALGLLPQSAHSPLSYQI